MVSLVGPRLYLRSLSYADITPTYVQWLNDADVCQTIVAGHIPQTPESIKTFLDSMTWPNGAAFAVCLKGTHRHIGNVQLRSIDWINRHADVGILIGDRAEWGQGLGAEAVQLISRYAFRDLLLRRLHAGTCGESAAKLFRTLGWIEEGCLRQHALVNGDYRDNRLFGLLVNEFQE